MKTTTLFTTLFLQAFLLAGLMSCGKSGNSNESSIIEEETTENDETSEEVQKAHSDKAVCIYDKTSLKDSPTAKGKWISSLNLGETLKYLGEEVVDSSEKKPRVYYHIELSDGKRGWASSWGVLIDSYMAAVKDATPIYDRPDILTVLKKELNKMDVVAVTEEKDDFIHIVSTQRSKEGWIKKIFISTDEEDLATAVMATKQFKGKLNEASRDSLKLFIDKLPYKNTQFTDYLNQLLDEAVNSADEFEETAPEGGDIIE